MSRRLRSRTRSRRFCGEVGVGGAELSFRDRPRGLSFRTVAPDSVLMPPFSLEDWPLTTIGPSWGLAVPFFFVGGQLSARLRSSPREEPGTPLDVPGWESMPSMETCCCMAWLALDDERAGKDDMEA